MAKQNTPAAIAKRMGGLDVECRLRPDDLAAQQAAESWDGNDQHRHDDRHQSRSEGGADAERQQDTGKGEHDVETAHCDAVPQPSGISRRQAKAATHDQREHGRADREDQRQPGAVNQPARDVATEFVGAECVTGRQTAADNGAAALRVSDCAEPIVLRRPRGQRSAPRSIHRSPQARFGSRDIRLGRLVPPVTTGDAAPFTQAAASPHNRSRPMAPPGYRGPDCAADAAGDPGRGTSKGHRWRSDRQPGDRVVGVLSRRIRPGPSGIACRRRHCYTSRG